MCQYELHEYHGCDHMCQARARPCRDAIIRGFWCKLKENWKFAGHAWGEGECWKCAGQCPQRLAELDIPTEKAQEAEQEKIARIQAMLSTMTYIKTAEDSE